MSIHFASFGGTLNVNGKEAIVKALTYRMICEQSTWWLSEIECPITELRRLASRYPKLQDPEFCAEWLKNARTSLFLEDGVKHSVQHSIYGKIFDIWQATRDSGITRQDIRDHLEDLTGQQANDFFREAYQKINIANGHAELCWLSHAMRQNVAGGNGMALDKFFAKLCWNSSQRFPIQQLLDCTPAMISRITIDTTKMDFAFQDDCAYEVMASKDKKESRRFQQKYMEMAQNLLEGKKINSPRPATK